MGCVETAAIAHLLEPFIELDESRLRAISTYIDLLLKWNARINLTAIREPSEIVQRHFGESLFVAKYLLDQQQPQTAIDLGSGAGFPGVPFAMLAPEVQVTLIESQQKKGTFLKELIHALGLKNVKVFGDRAENYPDTADLVMLRAVEKFDHVLPMAERLTKAGGRIALMIGSGQAEQARRLSSDVNWANAVQVPCGTSRQLLVGTKSLKVE
ncbi:MAG TPA: 16S rRNA (guanine(527)-N(7))-methyltransferase RsmG [Candidatus Angelobacter sp.]|nr:16S rRNA (guanine(527)-N(7))-methyltransferase RsmG [Candidatus Angelobacter sp.]